MSLHTSAAGDIDEFLRCFAADIGWDDAAARRLRSAGEEALISLLPQDGDSNRYRDGGRPAGDDAPPQEPRPSPGRSAGDRPADSDAPSLTVAARHIGAAVEMEFLAVFDDSNLEDRLAHLHEESQSAAGLDEGEISLRLLQHYASSVHHQKFPRSGCGDRAGPGRGLTLLAMALDTWSTGAPSAPSGGDERRSGVRGIPRHCPTALLPGLYWPTSC